MIQLDRCFDLTESRFTDLLTNHFPTVEAAYRALRIPLPENKGGDSDLKLRLRDCIVINDLLRFLGDEESFSSVRGAFAEGGAAYEGAMISRRSHIQIAVRDPSCIKGVFRPTLNG